MQEYFYALADSITASLHADEFYTCTFHAEDSDFVRFNRGRVRQPWCHEVAASADPRRRAAAPAARVH